MSLKFETPKTLTATDMFIWWSKNKIRRKRHMKVLNAKTNSRDTILVSRNKDELTWLRQNVIVLDEQIQKLEQEDKVNKYTFTSKTMSIYEKKRELYDANKRIEHLEKVDGDTQHVVMSERIFRDVLCKFNTGVKERLVQDASIVNMKSYLGFLLIKKIDRNKGVYDSKSTRMPNWPESNKYKQELIDQGIQIKDKDHPDGKNWIVYFDDDYYLRYSWIKKRGACRVKNHNYYAFIPSSGKAGAKKLLIEANRKNPFLHSTYQKSQIYYPNLDKIKEIKK